MNQQKILLSFLFSLILVSSLVSALSLSTPAALTLGNNQTTVIITNNNNVTQNVTLSLSPANIISGSSQVSLALSQNTVDLLASSGTKALTLSATDFIGTFPFGTYSSVLTATGVDSSTGDLVSNATTQVTYSKSFCKSGSVGGNLSLEVDISNTGDDDTTWLPLDDVTVKVRVNNENNDVSIKEVIAEIGLYDETGKNVIGDLEFISSDDEKVTIGTISDGSDEQVEFEFKVPADFETGDYKLVVKAYSDKTGETKECADTSSDLSDDFFETITVDSQDDKGKYIAFDNVQLSQNEATCGETLSLDFDAFNVGSDDQDRVRVNLVSKDLGIDSSQEIRSGIDAGNSESLTFPVTIPTNLEDKIYYLLLSADYDYRNGNYKDSSDEELRIPVKVMGCSAVVDNTKLTSLTASLTSDAKAGSPMTISSRITNLATTSQMLIVDATGYSSWASLDSISDRVLSLSPGESKDVTFKFNVNSDASGDKTFQIQVRSDKKTESKDVTVSIAKSSGLSFGSNSSLIWVIGIINLVLIILIIFVAIRIARR